VVEKGEEEKKGREVAKQFPLLRAGWIGWVSYIYFVECNIPSNEDGQ
jgi:hypothetical protein